MRSGTTSVAPAVFLLARGDYALVASASFPAKSVAELVGMARANPGKIYYASPGSGLPAHLMMEVFKSTMGIDLVHVPYKSNAAAVSDLVGGQVSLMFTSVGVALPLAEGGRIRILAAGAEKRAARTPEIPSFIESGVKDFNVGTWFAMLAPRGTPREVRAKLYADITALLKEPAVAELMLKQGMTPAGGTPEELHDLIRSDFERWNRIVREADIKAD